MAPPSSRTGRSGVRVDFGLSFAFQPSMGLMARGVDTMSLNIKSFREPLKRSIQQVLAPSFRKNFEAEGRPIPWADLAEHTVEMRGDAGPILVRSGLLKRTIQQLNVWTIDRTKAAIVDLPQKIWYGKVQQAGYGQGGSIKGKKNLQVRAAGIPARPFVMIQEEDYKAIDKVFERWLEERWARSMAITRAAIVRGGGRL